MDGARDEKSTVDPSGSIHSLKLVGTTLAFHSYGVTRRRTGSFAFRYLVDNMAQAGHNHGVAGCTDTKELMMEVLPWIATPVVIVWLGSVVVSHAWPIFDVGIRLRERRPDIHVTLRYDERMDMNTGTVCTGLVMQVHNRSQRRTFIRSYGLRLPYDHPLGTTISATQHPHGLNEQRELGDNAWFEWVIDPMGLARNLYQQGWRGTVDVCGYVTDGRGSKPGKCRNFPFDIDRWAIQDGLTRFDGKAVSFDTLPYVTTLMPKAAVTESPVGCNGALGVADSPNDGSAESAA
jgi:hypothetical protein